MKNYIFLNTSIAGVGGAELYISHKCEHLKHLGYDVYVFSFERGNIAIKNLLQFEKFVLPELKVPFRRSNAYIRRKILSVFCNLDLKGQIIIESNIDNLNTWGEFIAKSIKAYHICYLLPETNMVCTADIPFYKFKYVHHQLFGILDSSISKLFHDGKQYPSTHLPAVGCNTGTVSEQSVLEIPELQHAEYTILSLGRLNKPYILPMLDGVKDFIQIHTDSRVNLLIVGGYLTPEVKDKINVLKSCSNISVFMLGEQNPIPQNLFRESDVAIATAGSARVCSRQGLPTIIIDANDLKGIGVYNYTTSNTIFRKNEPLIAVLQLLEEVLVKKLYPKTEPKHEASEINYTYHDALLNIPSSFDYYDVSYKPDCFLSGVIKFAINLLGVSIYYKLIGYIKKLTNRFLYYYN